MLTAAFDILYNLEIIEVVFHKLKFDVYYLDIYYIACNV